VRIFGTPGSFDQIFGVRLFIRYFNEPFVGALAL
jgi:hypothetical protein